MDTGDPETVVLAQASTPLERRLIEQWISEGAPGHEEIAPGTAVRSLPLSARRLASALVDRTDDPLLLPVKITWLPPERGGRRSARISDVIALTNPRNPNRLIQRHIVRSSPDRWRVITGEPAPLDELRARFAALEEGADEAPGTDGADGGGGSVPAASATRAMEPLQYGAFARFIVNTAVVTLARSERELLGERYKVPRVVAEQIMDSPRFRHRVEELGREKGLTDRQSLDHAQASLDSLVAVQSRLVSDVFTQIMHPLYGNAWTVDADESRLTELRELNKTRPLVFLPSHRSYADAFVLGDVLARNEFPRNHLLGGANLQFWPIGAIAKRTGTVFIRRSFGDDTIYKASLEEYFAHLLSKRFNLEWYFEGGRTRTGKLRKPKYGLLNYVANSVRSGRVNDALLVPVSITYERMAEVGAVAAEQMGAAKQPEGLKWMARYARGQQRRAGNVYVRFGDPISLRDQLTAAGDPDLAAGPDDAPATPDEHDARARLALQKTGIEVAVGINRATPVTINSLVTLALLGVRDRALTLSEVAAVIAPVREYLDRRDIPQGELSVLDTDAGLANVLRRLADGGVVTVYDGGVEPVYAIEPGQHIVAAFYRNSGIHWFVNRAILELSIVHAHQGSYSDPARAGWEESKRLRDLLKFEFFFPERDTFEAELTEELELVAPEWRSTFPSADVALERLVATGFFMAHRTLRSFFGAQLVVAERLAVRTPDTPFDRAAFLAECSAVGRQMLLQGRLYGPESLSLELFAAAVELADNRGLLGPGGTELAGRREEFAEQLRAIVRALAVTEALDVSNRKEQP
ncbi:glycerol-3-phosphate 1-O-acyltransferase [Tomitella fengzijianii]|uniref:Glycerol-3-phosphate 1-O-acyltransferase n=1 Tax=Tomitella fengzijianii TaxID=2597660 RepID=A0A516X416_9ACTN|nr:glycerol-3-phosphate 1-O-acyltransferase [Tomitella fengzijianii]QDQ97807.1 glycerol-3-phosphate 1-O-acyltransferase [Tomitella fengzijianii]